MARRSFFSEFPNDKEQRMEHAIEIPRLSSLILKHDLDAPLKGLDTVAPENRPPVKVVFWTFRVMVGLGFLMLLLGVCSLLARATRKLYDWRWLHRFALVMGPAGFMAVIAGWMTTEVGRQPFTIYGLLRTADSVSPLAAPAVAASLIAFVLVYFAVFGMGSVVPAPAHVARAAAARARFAERAGARRGNHAGTRARRWWQDQGGASWMRARCSPTSGPRILAFAVFMYVVMDGFDLGIGILFPVFGVGRERDTAMNSIAPVWDGNETWLVLGGGGLMAAFPLAYAIVMSALYAPLIAMLLALVFRGVAFEFRWRDPAHRHIWDFAFTAGSFVAAFMQGIMLGALLQGISVAGPRLRRRLVGLAHAVQPADRRERGRRLLVVRRLLAQLEDRRRNAEPCAPAHAHPRAGHARRDRRGERGHAVPRRRIRRALVCDARACSSPRRCRSSSPSSRGASCAACAATTSWRRS